MQTNIFRICAIGTDREALDYLNLISRGICSFESLEAKNLPDVDRSHYKSVLIDLQGVDTWDMELIHGFLSRFRIGYGTIFHSAPGNLSGLASCMCLGKSVYLHKPVTRSAVSEAILSLVSLCGQSEIQGVPQYLYGLDCWFDADDWQQTGFKPLLFHGEPGSGQDELVMLLGTSTDRKLTMIECENANLESIDFNADSRQLFIFKNLDLLSESARLLLVEWWIHILGRDPVFNRPGILATASTTSFVDAKPGTRLMKIMFGKLIHELWPLRSRWVQFHEVCKDLFTRACRKTGKNLPIDFSGEAYLVLGKHSWPDNIRELDSLINKIAVTCQSAKAGVVDLQTHGWIPDMKRSGKEDQEKRKDHFRKTL